MKNLIIALLIGYILGGASLLQYLFGGFAEAMREPMFWPTAGVFAVVAILPIAVIERM